MMVTKNEDLDKLSSQIITFTQVIQKVLRVSNEKKKNEVFKIIYLLNVQNNCLNFEYKAPFALTTY